MNSSNNGKSTSRIDGTKRLLTGVLPYCVVLFALVQFWTVQGAEQNLENIDFDNYKNELEYLNSIDAPKDSNISPTTVSTSYDNEPSTTAEDKTSDDNNDTASTNKTDEENDEDVSATSTELGAKVVPEVVKVAAAIAGVVGSSAMGGACCGCCMQKGKTGAGCCNWCCKCCDAVLDSCCPCCDEKCCHKCCKSCDKNCKCCNGCCSNCPECCGCDPECGCCRRCRACCPCCCKHDDEHCHDGHPDCAPAHPPHSNPPHHAPVGNMKKSHDHDVENGVPKGYMF